MRSRGAHDAGAVGRGDAAVTAACAQHVTTRRSVKSTSTNHARGAGESWSFLYPSVSATGRFFNCYLVVSRHLQGKLLPNKAFECSCEWCVEECGCMCVAGGRSPQFWSILPTEVLVRPSELLILFWDRIIVELGYDDYWNIFSSLLSCHFHIVTDADAYGK